jgi:hypothetical protein
LASPAAETATFILSWPLRTPGSIADSRYVNLPMWREREVRR